LTQALFAAKHPAAGAQRELLQEVAQLEHSGAAKNLTRNGDFLQGPPPLAAPDSDVTAGTLPMEWNGWQDEDSKGTIGWDSEKGLLAPGAALLSNVSDGCIIQTYQVQPGQRYFLSVMARRSGEGLPSISAGWKTPEGVWMGNDILSQRWQLHPEALFPEEPGPAEPWRRIFLFVTTPEGAGQMIVMPSASSQASDRDRIWFDDVKVYLLPER
jgi:hypothetical protein